MSNKILIPLSNKRTKSTTFIGCPYYNLIMMIYIECEFGKIATVIIPDVNINKNYKHTDMSLRWIQNKKNRSKGRISVPKNFWKMFDSKKRFIVMPIGFNCDDITGHSNYLIYDAKTKSMERFEPYGKPSKLCLNPPDLDQKIVELFNKKLGGDFIKKYYKPLDYCPSRCFQKIQENEDMMHEDDPEGFCSVWCFWYVFLRLSNPDVDREKLVEDTMCILDKKRICYTSMIRDYANKIVDFSKLVE